MQGTKSDTGHLSPSRSTSTQTLDIKTHLSGGKTITNVPLRYSTTAGEYGRYLSLIKRDEVTATRTDNEAAGVTDGRNHDSPECSTKSDILSIPLGWRRFTRLQSQIGMYRSSSFN
ncbi:hypothetical protein GHT06_018675 [Daphnia sinensis]|uniref:Uncharacterized protein n=1 Tax=Daphnia sinensis TaxID=1820382 RepID=A0AAD5L5I7_9CRUS|nr:hypothetical protein GHT06_018675 [Daphnia sinensis]